MRTSLGQSKGQPICRFPTDTIASVRDTENNDQSASASVDATLKLARRDLFPDGSSESAQCRGSETF